MKRGDKLYCKNSFTNQDFFKNGHLYFIKDIDEYGPGIVRIFILTHGGYTFEFGLEEEDDFYIWKWFYTRQDLRRIKLKKLQNV